MIREGGRRERMGLGLAWVSAHKLKILATFLQCRLEKARNNDNRNRLANNA